jgi:hypothetical protein
MNTNSTLTLKYRLSNTWREAQFAATGQLPELDQVATYDMTQATPEQRQAILAVGGGLNLNLAYSNYSQFDGEPTIDFLAAACQAIAEKSNADRRKKISDELTAGTKHYQRLLQSRDPHESNLWTVSRNRQAEAISLGQDVSEYLAAETEYKHMQPDFEREAAEARARREAVEAETSSQRQAEADAIEAAKRSWIVAHGSDYLKRACLQHGYDCHKKYVLERAALEAPDYIVDYIDAAEWKSRACPSEAALDELERIGDIGTGEVVWLTAPAQTDKAQRGYDQGYEPFEQCEAVVIRGYLGKYDLVKII